mgnify:CR=1 FL=1
MKKLILVFAVFALVGASSCKKAYTCTCTASGSTGGFVLTNDDIPGTTKSSATSACSSYQTAEQAGVTASGGTGTVTCSI